MTTRKQGVFGDRLTKMEMEMIRLVAEGLSRQEIADVLYVTLNTVKSHLLRAYRKLGARNCAHAVTIGFRQGWL